MKENSEKAMEVNNELRLNVDELPEPHEKYRPVCVTCNQTLALQNGCKKNY